MGNPHQRLVYLNSDESQILWRDPSKPTEKPRFIICDEIENVVIGADHTKVMQRHKIPVEFDSFCLSIIAKSRTLDLRIDDQNIISVWLD